MIRPVAILMALSVCSTEEPEKLTPEKVARQLLETVHDGAAAADPQLRPFLLWRVAEIWSAMDSKYAVKLLEQAFESGSAIPPSAFPVRAQLQISVAASMQRFNANRAAEMLSEVVVEPGGRDPRNMLASSLLMQMTMQGHSEKARALISALVSHGPYPYSPVGTVIGTLPPGDSLRIILFGNTISQYQTDPGDDFVRMVAGVWKQLPRSMVEIALNSIIGHAARYDEKAKATHYTFTTAKGTTSLPTREDNDLFTVGAALRACLPDKLDALLQTHPDLKRALELVPDGPSGAGIEDSSLGIGPPKQSERSTIRAVSYSLQAQALAALPDSPDHALEIGKTIPSKSIASALYGNIVSHSVGTDDALARKALTLEMEALDQVDDVDLETAAVNWTDVINVAWNRLQDLDLAKEAIEHSFKTLARLYKADADPEDPNQGPIDWWPSTRACRLEFREIARAFGMDSTAFFERVRDPGMLMEAQVAVAAGLLNRPLSSAMIVTRTHPNAQSR